MGDFDADGAVILKVGDDALALRARRSPICAIRAGRVPTLADRW
jgi:hypothetical protein